MADQHILKHNNLQGPGSPARQLRRVTVVVDDPGEAQFLSGALRGLRNLGAEVVAARPTTDRVLTFLCESADVDVISLDVRGGRAGFALTAKQAERAIARGLAFEVQYAGAIEESAAAAGGAAAQTQQQQRRQQVLANIAAVVTATRGRGLVWSSGADRAEWLRGPHDVMNLAVVLGLKEVSCEVACVAIFDYCYPASYTPPHITAPGAGGADVGRGRRHWARRGALPGVAARADAGPDGGRSSGGGNGGADGGGFSR
jgi:RNase P/RNase MRP subunit p30